MPRFHPQARCAHVDHERTTMTDDAPPDTLGLGAAAVSLAADELRWPEDRQRWLADLDALLLIEPTATAAIAAAWREGNQRLLIDPACPVGRAWLVLIAARGRRSM